MSPGKERFGSFVLRKSGVEDDSEFEKESDFGDGVIEKDIFFSVEAFAAK